MGPPDLHERVAEQLRQAGQRYTAGRRRLVDLLARSDAPVTLPQLLATDPSIPQSSGYRNLAVLEQVGAVTRIVTNRDFASYELTEDLTGRHHHHLLCIDCGYVADFSLAARVERQLHKVLAGVAAAADYEFSGHRVDLLGRCASCR